MKMKITKEEAEYLLSKLEGVNVKMLDLKVHTEIIQKLTEAKHELENEKSC